MLRLFVLPNASCEKSRLHCDRLRLSSARMMVDSRRRRRGGLEMINEDMIGFFPLPLEAI